MFQLTVCACFKYFGLFIYDEKLRTCFMNRTYSKYLLSSLGTIGIVVQCLLITFFYIKIFIYTIKIKQRAQSQNRNQHEIDLKFSIGLFLSILLFVITYAPFTIILMTDYKDILPASFHLYGFLLMRINSCLNPLLYGLTSTLFRKGFQNIYFLLFDRKKYSFSIEVRERKLLNERNLCQEIELKNFISLKKEEKNLK
jgi:hypothetical protein